MRRRRSRGRGGRRRGRRRRRKRRRRTRRMSRQKLVDFWLFNMGIYIYGNISIRVGASRYLSWLGLPDIYHGWGFQMSIMVGTSRYLSWWELPDIYHGWGFQMSIIGAFFSRELHQLQLFFNLEEIPINPRRTARASQHRSKDENFSTLPKRQEVLTIASRTRFPLSQNHMSFSTSLQRRQMSIMVGASRYLSWWELPDIYHGGSFQISIMVGASRYLSWWELPDIYHGGGFQMSIIGAFFLRELHQLQLFFNLEEIPINPRRTARASQNRSKDETSAFTKPHELLTIAGAS
jgi:hypothetical protein